MPIFIIRRLAQNEIPKIAEIDRTEETEGYYVFKQGILTLIAEPEIVTSFDKLLQKLMMRTEL